MDPLAARIAELSNWLDAWVGRVRTTAAGCVNGGDPTWDAVLSELGVEPLPDHERRRHLTEGPPHRGAAAIEVRRALEVIERWASAAARKIDLAIDASTSVAGRNQRAIDRVESRLGSLVDTELRAHLAATKPAVTTSSIFANARASAKNPAGAGVAPGLQTLSCGCCGAPRRGDASTRECEFCGSRL